jgi:hypothetical protein
MATVSKTTAKPSVDALAILPNSTGQRSAQGNGVDIQTLMAQLQALQAENERLKAAKARAVTMKVSEKGAVSIYGMGRFPMTAYASQWQKVLDMADDIRAFIETNKASLAWKD